MKSKEEFDKHWKSFHLTNLSPRKKLVAKFFLRPVIDKINNSKEILRVLDFGCGNGIHATVLKEQVTKKFEYTGIDISIEAIKLCKNYNLGESNYKFLCKDIMKDKLDQRYDIIFSYGSIAYTSDPINVLSCLKKALVNNGIFVSWIYTPNVLLKFILIIIRIICKLFGKTFTNFLAIFLVYTMKYLPISSGVNLSNSSFDQCKETILVNINPINLFLPSNKKANDWFVKSNFILKHSNKYYDLFM